MKTLPSRTLQNNFGWHCRHRETAGRYRDAAWPTDADDPAYAQGQNTRLLMACAWVRISRQVCRKVIEPNAPGTEHEIRNLVRQAPRLNAHRFRHQHARRRCCSIRDPAPRTGISRCHRSYHQACGAIHSEHNARVGQGSLPGESSTSYRPAAARARTQIRRFTPAWFRWSPNHQNGEPVPRQPGQQVLLALALAANCQRDHQTAGRFQC